MATEACCTTTTSSSSDVIRFAAGSCASCGSGAALGLSAKPRADEIDAVLHTQRGLVDGARVTHREPLDGLPDGVFIRWHDEYWLLHNGMLHRWTPGGYTERRDVFGTKAAVLTPPAIVDTMRSGYIPGVHPSADG